MSMVQMMAARRGEQLAVGSWLEGYSRSIGRLGMPAISVRYKTLGIISSGMQFPAVDRAAPHGRRTTRYCDDNGERWV